MPQRILCENCEEILYAGTDLRPPEEVIQQFNGKCPKCGKRLFFSSDKIEIKPIQ